MLTSRRVRLQLLGWGTVAALGATLLLGSVPAVEASSAGLRAAPEVAASAESGGAYTALAPTRLLDTRTTNPLGPGQSLNLDVLTTGVSAEATAVALNVTVTGTTSAGYLSAYPTGGSLPGVSNLNWEAGETVANLVIVPVGSGGDVTFYNSAGSTEVVVDLEGFFAAATTTAGSYVPLAPDRVTDTRSGSGFPNEGRPLGAGSSLTVQLAGAGGIPASGAAAALINVTVTETTAGGYLTVYPAGTSLPTASNLNWVAGETVATRVLVPVGSSGQVTLYNSAGTTEVTVDVDGYFTDGSTAPSDAGLFTALSSPVRLLDSRVTGGALGPGGVRQLSLAGTDGIAPDATAVVTNVTAVDTTAASYLTVYPGGSRPTASDLNWTAGEVVPNLTVATLSGEGSISIYNHAGKTDVVVDAFGYFTTPPPTTATPSLVYSANWSGYEYQDGPYSSVTGTFDVPNLVASPSATDAAEWVGIDGADNSDLIQAGVGEQYSPSTDTVQIQAWWEILPNPETPINTISVVPGDSITVAITHGSGTQWSITLTDNTTGRSFSTQPTYDGPGASAEWVVEAPTVDTVQSTLGDYTPEVNFSGIAASGSVATVTEVVMEQGGSIVSVPSAISSQAFNVAYGSSAPAAP